MSSKKEFLTELVRENDLDIKEDIFKLQLGGKEVAIITRTGVEKIQYKNSILVKFDWVSMSKDYACIKAEKRALARAVLKLSGAYKYGVYGEDESDDFKNKGV